MTPDEERYIQLLKAKRAILKSRDSLLAFAQYMRPDLKHPDDADRSTYVVARHHEYIAHHLERLERGEIKRLIISCPPRHGKSELAQKTFIPWVIGRNPDWHVMAGTYNQHFAEDFGRAVRTIMQDPRYANVFPSDRVRLKTDAQSASRLFLEGGSQLHFVGRGGSATGRGGHLLAIDDPIKDREEADSPTIRDKLWAWWTSTFSNRQMTDDARILIIQTRWHEDDLIGRLTDPNNPCFSMKEASLWTVVNLPALAEKGDPLGRAEGEVLWPQRFSTTFMAQMRNQDPRAFSALYQGRPAPDDGLFFNPGDLVEYHNMRQIPEAITWYAASDHAVSTEQWADKSCFIVFGVDNDDDIWIHPDTVLDRLTSDRSVEIMLNLMRRHQPVFWWGETGHISKSIGPFLRKRMAEERIYCSLIEMAPVKDKQTRAQSIKGRMAMKKVHFPAWAPWYEEAKHQLMTFPAGTKDDFVDALSMVGLGLSLQFSKRKATPKKQVKEGTFGHLLEQSNAQRRKLRLDRETKGW